MANTRHATSRSPATSQTSRVICTCRTRQASSDHVEALGVDPCVRHPQLGQPPLHHDNDLPLPPAAPTFGYTTAVDVGKDLVHNLMKDAAITDRWDFVTIMGRHAGHLALG